MEDRTESRAVTLVDEQLKFEKTVAVSDQVPEPEEKKLQSENPRQFLIVLSAFIVFFNTMGLVLAFGSFQDYYQRELLPDRSSSQLAWIPTVCAFFLLCSGIISGPAFDYGYLRPMLVIGSLLEVFGLMMISLSTQYYQIFLSQGICIGLGCGMLYIPSISAAATAFSKPATRAKIMGLIASATGIGGIIYPIMFDRLLPLVGFGWTVRIMAFVLLGTYLFAYPVLIYVPRKGAAVRQFIDISAFKELSFISISVSGLLLGLAYYTPILFLPLFAQTHIPDFGDSALGIYLIAITNAASIFGRIMGGLVAAKIGPLETFAGALALCSLLLFCWTAVCSLAGVVAWSVAWGLTSSVIVSLPGAFVPLLSPSLSVVGTRSGMFWTSVGIGCLAGSPIGGAILSHGDGREPSWWPLQIFTGIVMILSAALVVMPMLHLRKTKGIK